MKTRKLVSVVLAPRAWIACAAMVALGAVGCGDSGTVTKRDGSLDARGGTTGAGGVVSTGGRGSGGAGGVRIDGGAIDGGRRDVSVGPGIDGGGGAIDAAGGTGGRRIDGGGTGGRRIDGGGGAGGVALDGGRDVNRDVRRDVPITTDTRDAPAIDGPPNCGASGQACCAGGTCNSGGCCVAIGNDRVECVAQGESCGQRVGGVCTAGACASDAGACGTAGAECCVRTAGGGGSDVEFCSAGNLVCARPGDASARACVACGALDGPCCGIADNRTCTAASTVCVGDTDTNPGTCEACGALDQRCCDNQTCASATLVCDNVGGGTQRCVTCGGDGDPCCEDDTCTGNLNCVRGTCQ